MRVSKEVVKQVVHELAGKDAMGVTNCIYKESVAEEDIAKKMKQELKQTRNILYKLQKHNLVQFQRKRNDANGWYTYFWLFNKDRVTDLSKKIKEGKLERLQYRLGVEEITQFFSCQNKCVRVDFDSLMNLNYTCPECGLALEQCSNCKKIKEIKLEIKEIKKSLKT